MFAIEKTLPPRFATLDDAPAPLLLARPWMKNVDGDLCTPESYFVYQHGEGKQRIRYHMCILAKKDVDRYVVVVRLERVSVFELLSILLPLGLFSVVLAIKVPAALLYVVPVLIIVILVRLAFVLRHTDAALNAFSVLYETA